MNDNVAKNAGIVRPFDEIDQIVFISSSPFQTLSKRYINDFSCAFNGMTMTSHFTQTIFTCLFIFGFKTRFCVKFTHLIFLFSAYN